MARPGRGARRRPEAPDHGHDRASQVDPHPQQLARHRLRPLDQRLSRLRARLHLLLRPADPRLSRPLARRGFRIAAVREAQRGAAAPRRSVAPGLRMPPDRDGHQHRSLSADRGALADHPLGRRAAARDAPPLHHHHQVGPGAARPRPAEAGRGPAHRLGRAFGDVARPQGRANARAARAAAAQAPRRGQGAERRRRALLRRDRAGRPADHRSRARAYRRGRGRSRRAGRLLSSGAPAARSRAACSAPGSTSIIPTAPPR